MCIFAKKAMRSEIDMYKGIRPGKIVGLELQERNLSQRAFAAAIDEHKQTLNAVITGRRKLTVEMALKIEKALGYDEGFLLTLQAYYEIAEYKNRKANESVRGAPAIRRMLFWDTDFDKIDWGRSKESILERVMERGDENENRRSHGFTVWIVQSWNATSPIFRTAYRINTVINNDRDKAITLRNGNAVTAGNARRSDAGGTVQPVPPCRRYEPESSLWAQKIGRHRPFHRCRVPEPRFQDI